MFARRALPPHYGSWNERWGAPNGYRKGGLPWPLRGTWFDLRRRGPFAFQVNSTTREYEYPWVYEQVAQKGRQLTIVDVGGSLAGMQFVLAQSGHHVINVDPGLNAGGLGWDLDHKLHRQLCKVWRAPVEVIPKSLADSGIPKGSVDVVVCISALEHFSADDVESTAFEIRRIMKPDGLAVFTVDCFLDLQPFTDATANEWGHNVSVYNFLARAGLKLRTGNPGELLGFPEFAPGHVQERLPELLVNRHYPCLAQCFTAALSEHTAL